MEKSGKHAENKRVCCKSCLPSEQERIEEIEREKAMIVKERGEQYKVYS